MYCVVVSANGAIIQVEGPYISQSAAMVDIRESEALAQNIGWMKDIKITRVIYPLIGSYVTEEKEGSSP